MHRPVNTSVRPFPGPSKEEDTATDGPGPAVATVSAPEADVPSSAEVKSSLDRVETQARESLAKLKHLLYKLRTRKQDEVKSTLLATPSYSGSEGVSNTIGSSSTAAVVEDQQQIFVSQKIEVDLSKPADGSFAAGEAAGGGFQSETDTGPSVSSSVAGAVPMSMRDIDLASLKGGLEIQLDALTATRATVTFDDTTQTAIVTLTATVRAAELEDKGSFSEKAIATAVKALARTCSELDEKAQASAAAASSAALMSPPSAVPLSKPPRTVQADSTSHQKVQRDLLSGTVLSWEVAPPEYGSTPFRPVYAVKLQRLDGTLVDALFKPTMPGDKTLRWKRAPEDWVAYQVGSTRCGLVQRSLS